MKIRMGGAMLLVLAAGAGPVMADCCDSFFDCAATVVTEGVSCEIQTILDTIKNLITEVTNFGNDITGITRDKEQAARQSVTDTFNSMQSQSQQGESDLTAALNQAKTIYAQEKTILPETAALGNTQHLQQVTANSQPPNSAPLAMTAQKTQPLARSATAASSTSGNPSGNAMMQQSVANAPAAASVVSTQSPHGAFADAFSRAVQQITTLKGTGDSDLSKVNQYLTQAQNSEGPGVAAADTLAGAMASPITSVLSQMSSMLANPLNAFDPTSVVDSVENSITAGMSSNIPQMIADITTGPNQAFGMAQPAYDDLLANAQSAQALAAAMATLYKDRTTAAATALYALLPQRNFTSNSTRAIAQGNSAAVFGTRQSYAVLSAKFSAAKQKALVVVNPPSLTKIHALVAQFKAQRAQGKSALPQSSLVAYKTNFTSQLNAYFNGKAPAAVAAQRDQLIAQARTKFAKDPATGNSVIALLNSEAAKRGSSNSATAAIATVPAQSTALSKPPVGAVAPVNPTQVNPAPVNPAVSQTKAPAWGATPATTTTTTTATTATPSWGQTGVQSSMRTTTTLKPASTLNTTQPAVMQSAPSSMGR